MPKEGQSNKYQNMKCQLWVLWVEMLPSDRMVVWAALGQSVGHLLNPPWSQESVKAREGVVIVRGLLVRLLLHRDGGGGEHGSHRDSGLLSRCRVKGEVEEAAVQAAQVTPGGADSIGGI